MAVIRPLSVPEPFRICGYNTGSLPPENPSTSIVAGAPVVVSTNGNISEASLTAANLVATGQSLAGVTNEAYNSALSGSGSVPVQQTKVSVTYLLPGVVLEANWWGDGTGGAADQLAQTRVGEVVALKKLTTGQYVATTTGTGAASFVVVGLVDKPGTLYGRLTLVPSQAERLFT